MLSIIIPIKQSLIKPDCLIRLIANIARLKSHQEYDKRFIITIADSSHLLLSFPILILSKLLGTHYKKNSNDSTYHYSPALVKNSSAEYCFDTLNASHILFLDVDVLITDEFIDHILCQVAENTQFDWYPVDFLIKSYGLNKMFSCIKNSHLKEISQENILQTGYATGIQLINKEFFKVLDGYCEDFLGYGCEDIELIHRASLLINLRPPFIDIKNPYYNDDRGYDPSQLIGFRNYFYHLKKQSFKDPTLVPKHFWHKRKNKSKYLQSRIDNDAKLISIMNNFDKQYISINQENNKYNL